MNALSAGLSMLMGKIAAVVSWFGGLFVAVFVGLWWLVTDGFVWIFDQIMSVAVSGVGSVSTGSIPSLGNYWGSLPAELLNVLGLIGFGEAFAILAAALAVRFALQLIPFVRLGS